MRFDQTDFRRLYDAIDDSFDQDDLEVVDNEGTLWLYYLRNDRELRRATIRRSR